MVHIILLHSPSFSGKVQDDIEREQSRFMDRLHLHDRLFLFFIFHQMLTTLLPAPAPFWQPTSAEAAMPPSPACSPFPCPKWGKPTPAPFLFCMEENPMAQCPGFGSGTRGTENLQPGTCIKGIIRNGSDGGRDMSLPYATEGKRTFADGVTSVRKIHVVQEHTGKRLRFD